MHNMNILDNYLTLLLTTLLLTIVQLFLSILKFYLDMILYSQCTNLCLLCSDVVNYFLGHK